MVMKNDDVFVIAQEADDIPLLGIEMQPFPRLPMKCPELCGKQVECKQAERFSKFDFLCSNMILSIFKSC